MKLFLIATGMLLTVLPAQAYFPEWTYVSSVQIPVYGLQSGDVNGDGRPEVVFRPSRTELRVVVIPEDGKMNEGTVIFTGVDITDFALADLDGDGHLDLVVADHATRRLVALHGNGDGTFGVPVSTVLPIAPTQILVADFDRDHYPDVVTLTDSGPIVAVFGTHGGLTFTYIGSALLDQAPYRAAVGDVDGDGNTDVVVRYAGTEKMMPAAYGVLFGNGDGTFDPPIALAAPGFVTSSDVILADLNDDGFPEIISIEADSGVDGWLSVLRNLGSRSFGTPARYGAGLLTRSPRGISPSAVKAFDATDDGRIDVIVCGDGSVETFVGSGDGTFATVGWDYAGSNMSITAGNFTGGNRLDLIVGGPNARLALVKNNPGALDVRASAAQPRITVGQTDSIQLSAVFPPNVGIVELPFFEGYPDPTGKVTFYEGDLKLGTVELTLAILGARDRIAKFDLGTPTLGTHQYTAVYEGDANYRPVTVTSNSLKVTVLPPPPPGKHRGVLH